MSEELIELGERVQETSLCGHEYNELHYSDFSTERAGFEVNFVGVQLYSKVLTRNWPNM